LSFILIYAIVILIYKQEENMIKGLEILCHSSIKISKSKIIYIDPFRIKEEKNDADYIFITHGHYDHFSEEDIRKIKNKETVIVVTKDLEERALKTGFNALNVITVEPDKEYYIGNITVKTIPAYNVDKQFHPKENNWVGYIINIDGVSYYIAGDTDITNENLKVKCDVALVPVGGTYTMDFKEASKLINLIQPKIAIPTHYGEIVGNKQDAEVFKKLIRRNIKCKILL